MDASTFQRILTTFADTPADVDISRGSLLLQIRDELIEGRIFTRPDGLHVEESSSIWPAEQWLIQRVARLQLLADRILSFIPAEPNFIGPGGMFLDQLENAPLEEEEYTHDVILSAAKFLGRRPGGTASVLYLTADAGEGKTTVINQLARRQALEYKKKETDWLLVPIPLGGRPFLRFDDAIVAALMNLLRFPFLYYDSFIELVRMGALVPALDGFEEMFIEGSPGDAVSALGNLMQALQSSGTVLIAARKAYFEYKRLETQARLFDTLGNSSVAFSRLSLRRWDRSKFVEYGIKRGLQQWLVDYIYEVLAARLGEDHALLTRAVLVKRLFDLIHDLAQEHDLTQESNWAVLEELLARLTATPTDSFAQFIRAIIAREAKQNWIDKSGEPAGPLIPEDEHYELLASVAQEMWTAASEVLRADVLDITAELFCATHGKSTSVSRQVIERLKQHALIVRAEGGSQLFAFDHAEFYHFFLGYAVGRALKGVLTVDIRQMLRRALLPGSTMDVAASYFTSNGSALGALLELFSSLSQTDSVASFVPENCGGIAVRVLHLSQTEGALIRHLTMPVDSLFGRTIAPNVFRRCYFQPTLVTENAIMGCRFESCQFQHIDLLDAYALRGVVFVDCNIIAVTRAGREDQVFAPNQVTAILRHAGAELVSTSAVAVPEQELVEPDAALNVTRRVFRIFMRSTELNETAIRQRLGVNANLFLTRLLPGLLDAAVMTEVQYAGRGQQRRFRLGLPLRVVNKCLERCEGSFGRFLEIARAERQR